MSTGPEKHPTGSGVMDCIAWHEVATALKLSPRELEIIRGVFDNLTDAAMAPSLGMSAHTVHSHMNRIFRKLNISTRAQLILVVMEEMLARTRADASCLPPICSNYAHNHCPLRKRI